MTAAWVRIPAGPVGARRAWHGRLTAMSIFRHVCRTACVTGLVLLPLAAVAAEHITLANGFDLVCDHRAVDGLKTVLYMDPGSANYIEVDSNTIVSAQAVPDPPALQSKAGPALPSAKLPEVLTQGELHQVLAGAGRAHDLDVDLLASVVHAESAGRVHARSRVGAEGLMQLMPETAKQLGVQDAYAPLQNVGGGAAYLDALLRRYHNNVAFALAAYNAGPAAVDRWHGIPPYRETRAYVARIIHEFNQRYAARQAASLAFAATPVKSQGN